MVETRAKHQVMTDPTKSELLVSSLIRSALAFLIVLYATGVVALMTGAGISRFSGVIGLLGGLGLAALVSRGSSRRLVASIWLAIFLSGSLLSVWFFDYSSDGVYYHKPAVIQFLDGWNPYADGSSTEGVSYWTAVYPKASWLLAAQLVAVAGWMEQGKVFNIIGMVLAALSAWRFISPRLPESPKTAIAAALLIGFNPVSVYQSLTFYLDGLLASFFAILLFSLAGLLKCPRDKGLWFEAFCAAVFLANLKLTGLVYAGLLLALFAVISGLQRGFAPFIKTGFATAAIVLVAVVFFGKTPYIDNVLAGRHVFYPALGGWTDDFSGWARPANFTDKDRFSRWLMSNMSHSKPVYPPDSVEVRWPLDLSKVSRHWVDVNIGGFGPLFAEALVICVVALIAAGRHVPKPGWSTLFILVGILGSSFLHSDGWWARYAPQMFALPVLGACFLARANSVWAQRAGVLTLSVLLLNLVIVGFLSTGTKTWGNILLSRGISEMRKASVTRPIEVDLNEYGALKRHLEEQGVRFVERASDGSVDWKPLAIFKTCFWRQGDDLSQ